MLVATIKVLPVGINTVPNVLSIYLKVYTSDIGHLRYGYLNYTKPIRKLSHLSIQSIQSPQWGKHFGVVDDS